MKLDFGFKLKSFKGNDIPDSVANETLISILETSLIQDKDLLKKSKIWGKELAKNKLLELDQVDMEKLEGVVLSSQGTFAVAKISILEYIWKRIEESKKQ